MAETKSPVGPQRMEVLKTVYPIFKNEVYARRQSMTWIAMAGSAALLGLLLVGSFQWFSVDLLRWPIILGVVVFSSFLIDQIRQQDMRHKQAKHELIEIEKALGFFEEDSYLPGRSLYPQTWQRLPERDWQYLMSVLSLVVLTALVILVFLAS
jgi:hypothetical protein